MGSKGRAAEQTFQLCLLLFQNVICGDLKKSEAVQRVAQNLGLLEYYGIIICFFTIKEL